MRTGILFAVAAAVLSSTGRAATFEIDPVHSGVSFTVRHMMVSKVRGRFGKFDGTFDYEPGRPGSWAAAATIDAASIDTGNERRDGHLRSGDFFDAERCPKIEFKSTKVQQDKDGKAKLHGELTMRCVTKPVVLDLELGGVAPGMSGRIAGANATGKINRKDFGVSWNKTLDSGGLAVSDEVDISIEVEGKETVKAPAAADEKPKADSKPAKRG